MLTIKHTWKLEVENIYDVSGQLTLYYINNITELSGAYQIHLRCPDQLKPNEIIVLLRTSDVIGPTKELTYAMYDNSNPLKRMYLRKCDISDMSRFVSSIQFLVNKYILC